MIVVIKSRSKPVCFRKLPKKLESNFGPATENPVVKPDTKLPDAGMDSSETMKNDFLY